MHKVVQSAYPFSAKAHMICAKSTECENEAEFQSEIKFMCHQIPIRKLWLLGLYVFDWFESSIGSIDIFIAHHRPYGVCYYFAFF